VIVHVEDIHETHVVHEHVCGFVASLCFVSVVFYFGVDDGLCMSAAVFPDDDMARSDSRMSEESQRIQAKCLMETHVKVFFGFV